MQRGLAMCRFFNLRYGWATRKSPTAGRVMIDDLLERRGEHRVARRLRHVDEVDDSLAVQVEDGDDRVEMEFDPDGACIATANASRTTSNGTGRSRSSRLRTARVVLNSSSGFSANRSVIGSPFLGSPSSTRTTRV